MSEYNLNPVLLYTKQLLEQYKNKISENQFQHGIYVIEQFNNWYHLNSSGADDLYILIVGDCESDMDTDCILVYAECGDDEDEDVYYMWQTLLCIFMAIIYIAYKRENREHVPQDVEAMRFSRIEDFFKLIEENTKTPKELFEYFQEELCY